MVCPMLTTGNLTGRSSTNRFFDTLLGYLQVVSDKDSESLKQQTDYPAYNKEYTILQTDNSFILKFISL